MYAFMIGRCVCCTKIISFNPVKVPSIRVEGKREPICRACIDAANEIRKMKDMEPFPEPHPEAYEVCREEEL